MGLYLMISLVVLLIAFGYFYGEFKQAEWKKRIKQFSLVEPPLVGWNRFWELVSAGFNSFTSKGQFSIFVILLCSILIGLGYGSNRYNHWNDMRIAIAIENNAEEIRLAQVLAHENQQRAITLDVAKAWVGHFISCEEVDSWIEEQGLVIEISITEGSGKETWIAGGVTSPEVVEFLHAEKSRIHLAEYEALAESLLTIEFDESALQLGITDLAAVRKEIKNAELILRVDEHIEVLEKDLARYTREQDAKEAKRRGDAAKVRKKRTNARVAVEKKFDKYGTNAWRWDMQERMIQKNFTKTDEGLCSNKAGRQTYEVWEGTYNYSDYTFKVKCRWESLDAGYHYWTVTVSDLYEVEY